MKRLLLILVALLTLTFTACAITTAEPDYREQMTEVPAKAVYLGMDKYYASHEFVLNEDYTLYYLPARIETDEKIYLNNKTGYYLVNKSRFTTEYQRLESADLKFIFEGE